MSSRILPDFDLLVPQSMNEAVDLLEKYGEKVAIMAGGTDLMVLMKNGFSPEYVLSLNDIPGLRYLDFDAEKGLRIGARVTLAKVLKSPVVKEKYPALYKAAYENGTLQTKNVATVLGNILRASPAGDCCCAVLAYGGSVILQGPDGRREVSIDDFWIDYCFTARKSNEVAVELKLPAPEPGTASSFAAMTRTKKDLAKINASVCLKMNGKVCEDVRLAMGAVARTHIRLKRAESVLKGKEITDGLLKEVQERIPKEISPIDDVRSTAEYRRQVASVLVKRIIQDALGSLN
jgi:aerobic carbon-monoxide dehydrogenase medium subunit